MNIRLDRADGLLAALPGGTDLIQIRLRYVLQGAQFLVAVECHFVVTRGQHGGFQAGLRCGNLRIQLIVRQTRLFQRDLRRLDLIAKRRGVELKQQIAFLNLAIVMDMYRRHDKVNKHQQERGNTHPYPAGKLLFRSHYFSVLLSSSRIVRKLQAI